MKTHKLEIEIHKNWQNIEIHWELSFSNWKKQEFQYIDTPPSITVDCMEEITTILKRLDDFNRKYWWDFKKFELTKI